MCAPSVIHEVCQDLSRRHFLTALGSSVAAAAVAVDVAHAQERPVRLPKSFRDIYDLTHTMSSATPVYQERDIAGVGVDTLSLDTRAAQKFVAHQTILGAAKYGVELLANLSTVPPAGAMVIIGGPKHRGASGGPARVFAVA